MSLSSEKKKVSLAQLSRKLISKSGIADYIRTPTGISQDTIFYKAAQITSAERVVGDYLEFGVYQGASFARAFEAIEYVYGENASTPSRDPAYRQDIQRMWSDMRFFAFDSFEGLPALKGIDVESRDFVEGQYAYGSDEFRSSIASRGVDLTKVITVPGWFDQTCNSATISKFEMRRASIIHIDCDLYESTTTVLDFIRPLITDGTVLIFDDWFCFRGNPNLGEQRAFREWAESLPDWTFVEYQKEGPWRNSFIACQLS